MIVKPGDRIPLNCQLWDGSSSMYVRAYLLDQFLNMFAAVSCAHAGRGKYTNDTVEMPNGTVYATYVIYVDAGFTVESMQHSRATDLIQNTPGGIVVKELSAALALPNLEAQVSSMNLNAAVQDQELTGTVVRQEQTGSVKAPEISGSPEKDNIEGTTVC